jgi:hypothetical protein
MFDYRLVLYKSHTGWPGTERYLSGERPASNRTKHRTFLRHSYWHRTVTAWLNSNCWRVCLCLHPSTFVTFTPDLRVPEFIVRLCTNCLGYSCIVTSQWQQACSIANWAMDRKCRFMYIVRWSKYCPASLAPEYVASLILNSLLKHAAGTGKALLWNEF